MEAAEEAGVHPGPGYSNMEHAQYDNSQYSFTQETNPFPIDQNLDMSVNFTSSGSKVQNEGLGATHMSLPAQNGHSGAMMPHPVSNNSSTSLPIAPQPQTPQSHGQSIKRKSPEDTSENNPVAGESGRKRSKVSRACDQCRKKKVRCDADAGDGTLKTCTNCIKQGQTCDYNRIPQKRGPSKGYIKDLSERVHHLEDSLANSGNYRSSVDAGSYPEPPFSPDEDSAPRRPASISQQRSPFADITRDRFPSVGGWTNNTFPSTQLRERGSIAIPPDQLGPSLPPSAKPVSPWPATEEVVESPMEVTDETTVKKPPSEKTPAEIERDKQLQAIETERDKLLQIIETETNERLQTLDMYHYYDSIHPECPILPEKERLYSILGRGSDDYVNIFRRAMMLLPHKSKNKHLSELNLYSRKYVEDFVLSKGSLLWEDKRPVDNLILLWTTLLLQVIIMHDMSGYGKQNLLTTVAIDQLTKFINTKDLEHVTEYETEWLRSLTVVALFARLQAISHGNSTDPVPSTLAPFVNTDYHLIAPRTRFVVMMTDMLQAALSTLAVDAIPATRQIALSYARLQSSNMRAWLNSSAIAASEPFVKEIDDFATLLSLRLNVPSARAAIVGPVCNLIETIRTKHIQQAEGLYVFSPFSFHTAVLASVCLLQLKSCDFDHQHGEPLVETATNDLVKLLKDLAAHRTELPGGVEGVFWADALIRFIEVKKKRVAEWLTHVEEQNEEDVVPSMADIIRQGYIMPLLGALPK